MEEDRRMSLLDSSNLILVWIESNGTLLSFQGTAGNENEEREDEM